MKRKSLLFISLASCIVIGIEILSIITMSESDYLWYQHQIDDILQSAMFDETMSRIPVETVTEENLRMILNEISKEEKNNVSSGKIGFRSSLAKKLNSEYSQTEDFSIQIFEHSVIDAFQYEGMQTNYSIELKERAADTTRIISSVYKKQDWCPLKYESYIIPANTEESIYYEFIVCICRLVLLWELPTAGKIFVGDIVLALLMAVVLYYDKKKKQLEKIRMDFANRIVHDLRNPLSVVFMSTELLESLCNDKGDKEMKELSGFIHKHLILVDEKIEELLILIRGKKNNGNTTNTDN